MNQMWKQGQGSAPADVAWGGILFPKASAVASRPVTVLYNTSAVHSFPTFTSAATNALRKQSGKITVSSQPLPDVGVKKDITDMGWSLLVTIMIIITFAFVPSAIVAFPVMESEAHHNSRHQQYRLRPMHTAPVFCVSEIAKGLGFITQFRLRLSCRDRCNYCTEQVHFGCLHSSLLGFQFPLGPISVHALASLVCGGAAGLRCDRLCRV
jgi:hypothetical protein